MMHEIKKYTVTIFDTVYTVRSDEPEELIKQAAELVDCLIREIDQAAPGLDHKTIAVLAALKLASKLKFLEFSVQAREQRETELIEKINTELSQKSLCQNE